MATTLSKISLGFAEFVSQLLQETFDAVMDTQHYQLEKYEEIQAAIDLTPVRFREKFISDGEFFEYLNSSLGFIPASKLSIPEESIDKIKSLMGINDFEKAVNKDSLTEFGSVFLTDYYTDKLVQLRKSKLRTFLNNPRLANLKVNSGEIKAKMELSCLSDYEEKEIPLSADSKEKQVAPGGEKKLFDIKSISKLGLEHTGIREVIDEKTKQKTLLIDKNKFLETPGVIKSIPGTRLVANPASSATSANVYSEITINFSL